MTFPLARLSVPVLPDSDDAYFSVWRLAWVAHQLPRDPLHLFDANIFAPATNTLAYSDAMLALGIMSWPAIASGMHPVVAHNLLVLAAFVTTGLAGFLLCRELSGSASAAFVGGVILAFAPYRFTHIGHLELLWMAPMPLAFLIVHRTMVAGRPTGHGLQLGGVVAFQALCSLYYAAFLGILLACWSAAFLPFQSRPVRRKVVLCLGLAAATAAVLTAPYALVYSNARVELGERRVDEIRQFSAVPSDYLRASLESKVYPRVPREFADERSLFPGVVALALAGVALILRRDRLSFLYAALLLVSFELSLGLNGRLYPILTAVAPPLTSLRAPARFAALGLVFLSVLAALGLHALIRARTRAVAAAVAALVTMLCVAEYWSAPVGFRAPILRSPNVYLWLARTKPRLVLELPLPSPSAMWYYESTHELMSIYHWSRLVNGYSGHAPRAYLQTLEIMQTFPSDSAIDHLQSLGVDYVIVHERFYEPAAFVALVEQLGRSPQFDQPMPMLDAVDPAWVFRLR
jgi:hypothetical protein